MNDTEELMTILDLKKRTKLSRAFWYARIQDGSLKHYRLGRGQGGIRISEEQYQEYLKAKEQGGRQDETPHALKHIR